MINYLDIHTHQFSKLQDVTSVYVRDFKVEKVNHPMQCLGLHPWWIGLYSEKFIITEINKTIAQDQFFAIGEIGLDKACQTDYQAQIDCFQRMLALTQTLPIDRIILHVVRAHSDILFWLKHYNIKQKILVHDYYASLETAQHYLKFDCYFSFGVKLLTHPKAQLAWKKLPKERVFLETDDANIPISLIYQKAAELWEISPDELKKQMLANFDDFSNKKSRT
jgi:TatD DNase family protein